MGSREVEEEEEEAVSWENIRHPFPLQSMCG